MLIKHNIRKYTNVSIMASKLNANSDSTLFGTPKRNTVLPRKNLFLPEPAEQNPPLTAPCWSVHEYLALVKFLLLHSEGKKWIAIKDARFWTKAGEFIKNFLRTSHQRSGSYIAIHLYSYNSTAR